jgi:hypothetical protein
MHTAGMLALTDSQLAQLAIAATASRSRSAVKVQAAPVGTLWM